MYSQIGINKRNTILLFIIFLIFIGIFIFLINLFFFQGHTFVIIAAVIAVIFSLISYYSGTSIVLAMTKAREANKKEHAYLINTVEG